MSSNLFVVLLLPIDLHLGCCLTSSLVRCCAGDDVAPEEPTIDSPKALTWRRNKLSDKERYEDDFYFEINGKRMVINQVRHTLSRPSLAYNALLSPSGAAGCGQRA